MYEMEMNEMNEHLLTLGNACHVQGGVLKNTEYAACRETRVLLARSNTYIPRARGWAPVLWARPAWFRSNLPAYGRVS